jgi:hypothetical protein
MDLLAHTTSCVFPTMRSLAMTAAMRLPSLSVRMNASPF